MTVENGIYAVIFSNFAAAAFNALIVMLIYLLVALVFDWFDGKTADGAAWAGVFLGLIAFFVTLISRQWT